MVKPSLEKLPRTLQWGILGPGNIARRLAEAIAASRTSTLYAIGSRSLERAEQFAEKSPAPKLHGSYEALLEDPGVEAVYIATPHTSHARWAILAAEAGKHVLCEKPIGLNAAQAMAIFEAAERHGVFIKEAFMYRCYPSTRELVRQIQAGAIGTVQLIEAAFSFAVGRNNPESRLLSPSLGGGGILDVGCYPVSIARLIAGAVSGQPFSEPATVAGTAVIGDTGVDDLAAVTLRFPEGILAQCLTGVALRYSNRVRVHGSGGVLTLNDPWFGQEPLVLEKPGNKPQIIPCEPGNYVYEVDAVARGVADLSGWNTDGIPEMPETWMRPEDSLGNMRVLDRWRAAAGLIYPAEEPGKVETLNGRTLRMPFSVSRPEIPRKEFPGLDKPVSRLVMGVDNQPDLPYLAAILDDYIERGGNVVDTAFIYGGGRHEKLLGEFLASRPGLRNEMVVVTKGAHSPYCLPGAIGVQLSMSLDRMGLDAADIYLMHRDNPDVPVGEFVDALNAERTAGRVRVFGVSNWSLHRIQEFNTIADAKGVARIGVVSNNFSLARMVEPVWKGCLAASEPEFRDWLVETGTPLLPWSSQARGVFTGRSGLDKLDDAEMVRCWYSEDNFERKRRATRLADARGVSPLNVALAYVLAQRFPVFALVGPRNLGETRTLLPALGLELTAEECAWLNLDRDTPPEGIQ